MRCHLATAVTVGSPTPLNPFRSAIKFVTEPLSDGLYLTDHLIAGATASAAAVTALHPMDTLKTTIQKAVISTSATSATSATIAATKPSLNLFSALVLTLRTGGVSSLYKGLSPSLLGQVPAGAIKFAAYESLTQLSKSFFPKFGHTAMNDYLCAALAFISCSVILVPGELIKQRLQANIYPTMNNALKSILKTSPKHLYTGYCATLVRDVPYTMLEFGLYAQLKRLGRSILAKQKLTATEELMLGGVAGGLTGFLTTPLDLAKTRLMTQGSVGGVQEYKGIVDCLIKVGKKEGINGLFKGSIARVIWLIPFTAVYFGVHEATKRSLLSRKQLISSSAINNTEKENSPKIIKKKK